MSSGIYVLKFPSGKYYIGKTSNFSRRWEEHAEKMRKGTAATLVQRAYNEEGFPSANSLFECHPDHAELLEKYYIAGSRGPLMLNSTFPVTGNREELDILNANNETLQSSTAEICQALQDMHRKYALLESKLERQVIASEAELKAAKSKSKTKTLVSDLKSEIETLTDDVIRYSNEVYKLKTLGLWDRIFKNY